MEPVDPHCHSLEPFFDVVPFCIVELTGQFLPSKSSQIAAAIDEKLCLGDFVFLGEAVQKRRRGVSPVAAVHVDFEQQLRVDVDCRKQPFFLAVNLDLLLVNGGSS